MVTGQPVVIASGSHSPGSVQVTVIGSLVEVAIVVGVSPNDYKTSMLLTKPDAIALGQLLAAIT